MDRGRFEISDGERTRRGECDARTSVLRERKWGASVEQTSGRPTLPAKVLAQDMRVRCAPDVFLSSLRKVREL